MNGLKKIDADSLNEETFCYMYLARLHNYMDTVNAVWVIGTTVAVFTCICGIVIAGLGVWLEQRLLSETGIRMSVISGLAALGCTAAYRWVNTLPAAIMPDANSLTGHAGKDIYYIDVELGCVSMKGTDGELYGTYRLRKNGASFLTPLSISSEIIICDYDMSEISESFGSIGRKHSSTYGKYTGGSKLGTLLLLHDSNNIYKAVICPRYNSDSAAYMYLRTLWKGHKG